MNKFKKSVYVLLLFLLTACAGEGKSKGEEKSKLSSLIAQVKASSANLINAEGQTIGKRFLTPSGFERVEVKANSYAAYLRNLPLKEEGASVQYYDGKLKNRSDVYTAVVDLPIGKRDLHQCADAVMRLKGEYLWREKKYEDIHFNFTNGFRVDYSEWMKGRRMIVKGNKTYWNDRNQPSNTYEDFWKYMELIFTYAGTLSLAKELQAVDYHEMKIGDVFIQGGSPGHAVVVVDMVMHPETKQQAYLLAQSYMPAQEIQVLKCPNGAFGPWYMMGEESSINTPEWDFYATDLKRFVD